MQSSVWVMASTVVTSLLGYVYWIVAARTFSTSAVGFGAALISAITTVSAMTNLGLQSALVQNLPKRQPGHERSLTFTTAVTVSAIASFIIGVVVAVGLPLASGRFRPLQTNPLYTGTFVLGCVLTTMLTMLDYTSLAELRPRNMFSRNSAFAALKIVLLIVPPLAAAGALGVFSSWIGAQLATVGLGATFVFRLDNGTYRLRFRGMVAHMRSLIHNTLGHHFINLGSMLPILILPILVTALVSSADNAYFYSAWRIAGFLFLLPPALGISLFAEGSHDDSDLWGKAARIVRLIGFVMVPVTVVGLFAAPLALDTFGAAYSHHATTLLQLYLIAALPDSVNNILLNVLRVQRRVYVAAAINGVVAVLTLAGACVLLPAMGLDGAGVAVLGAQLCGLALMGLIVVRNRHAVSH